MFSQGDFFPAHHPVDYQTLLNWANHLSHWYIPGESRDFVNALKGMIGEYLDGKTYSNAEQVLSRLKEEFFNPSGPLDVYMVSGLSNPMAVESVAKIFGVSLPPPTPMDTMIMRLLSHYDEFSPTPLLNKLLDHMLFIGSYGQVADVHRWVQQIVHTDLYLQAPLDVQRFFREFSHGN